MADPGTHLRRLPEGMRPLDAVRLVHTQRQALAEVLRDQLVV
jgi:hypothetical protein